MRCLGVFFVTLLMFAASVADAQCGEGRRGGVSGGDSDGGAGLDPSLRGAFFPTAATLDRMRARGLRPTGRRAAFPPGLGCPVETSPFGSTQRGDGSFRNSRFFAGYHSGTDIPVPEGTPVLAVADGSVVHLRADAGGGIGGITLVLQHVPADTGLPVWLYTEYKHLRERPDLPVGIRVRMGAPTAVSGKTGTVGGHYGAAGHLHLRFAAFYAPTEAHTARMIVVPTDGRLLDRRAGALSWRHAGDGGAGGPSRRREVGRCSGADDGGRDRPAGSAVRLAVGMQAAVIRASLTPPARWSTRSRARRATRRMPP